MRAICSKPTSTSPYKGSRTAFTIARRIVKHHPRGLVAGKTDRVDAPAAERTRHPCPWSSDMPPRTMGQWNLSPVKDSPAVNETLCRRLAHWWRRWFTNLYDLLCPHRGHGKPSGQRHSDRYGWQASSVAKSI